MGIEKEIYYIITCDTCAYKFENEGSYTKKFSTKNEAVKAMAVIKNEGGWVVNKNKVMCPWCVENER